MDRYLFYKLEKTTNNVFTQSLLLEDVFLVLHEEERTEVQGRGQFLR